MATYPTGFSTPDPQLPYEQLVALQSDISHLQGAASQHLADCMAECAIGIAECQRCVSVRVKANEDYIDKQTQKLAKQMYSGMIENTAGVGSDLATLPGADARTREPIKTPAVPLSRSPQAGDWCVYRMPGDSCAIAPWPNGPPGGGTLVACYPDESTATIAAGSGCGTGYSPGPTPSIAPPPPGNIPPLPPPYTQPSPETPPGIPPPPPGKTPPPPPPKVIPPPVIPPVPGQHKPFCVYCLHGRPRVIQANYPPPSPDWQLIGCSADPLILQAMIARCRPSPIRGKQFASLPSQPPIFINPSTSFFPPSPITVVPFPAFVEPPPFTIIDTLPLPHTVPPLPGPEPQPQPPPGEPPPSEPPPEPPPQPQQCIPTFSQDEYEQALADWLEAEAGSGNLGIYGEPCPPEIPPASYPPPTECPPPAECKPQDCSLQALCSPAQLDLADVAGMAAGIYGPGGGISAANWLGSIAGIIGGSKTIDDLTRDIFSAAVGK